MSLVSQTVFPSTQDAFPLKIPFHRYSFRNSGTAIDHLVGNTDQQPVIIGLSHRLSVQGDLEYICISSNERAAIIHFDDVLIPRTQSKQVLPLAQLLGPKFTLVGFNLAITALHLNHRTLLHVRGIDLSAVCRDPKKGSALSAADIVQKNVSDRANTWQVMRLWNNEAGQQDRDLCLQAWLAYCVASRVTSLETMVRIDTACLNRSELDLLARMVREAETLGRTQPTETVGDFSSATVDKSGHIKLLNSRYKTRIRRSDQAKVILTDSSGKDHWGSAANAQGKTTTINLQTHPTGNLTFEKVRIYGRQQALNHEKARDMLVIDLLTGVKTLRDAPFIRALWFPKWQPTFFVRGEGGVSTSHAEGLLRDVTLNDSQRRAALSMVSEGPLVVVHGPPGTGKTTTISASAKVWHAHRRPAWIVAHSNVAVKNIAASLHKHEVKFKLIVSKDFHFEWHEHLYEELSNQIIRTDDFNEDPRLTTRLFDGVHIVLCTLSMLSNPVLKQCGLLEIIPLERLVIDEASQINVFEYLHLFDKFSQTLEKACFFGDPHQLPPFGQTDAPTIQTIFDLKKITSCDHFLDTQYRMPTPIGEFISGAVYGGRLKSLHSITSSDCVKFIDVQGSEEKAGFSWKNRRETDIMVYLVKHYYSTENFCIITPYDGQRAMIRSALEQSNLPNDTVFNLDSFQGNEADYILVSVVRTNKPGFLTSIERLNVLLTRAKKGLVIVTSNSFMKKGGSGTLLGQMSRHWQNKYRPSSSWVDWRLVAQNQASLPGGSRAPPRSSTNSHVSISGQTGFNHRAPNNSFRPQPRVFSVNGPFINQNLSINDSILWPPLWGSSNSTPVAPQMRQWPSHPIYSPRTVPQAQKQAKLGKNHTNKGNNQGASRSWQTTSHKSHNGYNHVQYFMANIQSTPVIPSPRFSYGLYTPQMIVKPRARS